MGPGHLGIWNAVYGIVDSSDSFDCATVWPTRPSWDMAQRQTSDQRPYLCFRLLTKGQNAAGHVSEHRPVTGR